MKRKKAKKEGTGRFLSLDDVVELAFTTANTAPYEVPMGASPLRATPPVKFKGMRKNELESLQFMVDWNSYQLKRRGIW